MTVMAKCCHPVPGDPVVGYVTRGRGVTIHREDCRQVVHWRAENSPRLLQVHWGAKPATSYAVQLLIRAFDRRDLIRDISIVLSTSDAQVTDISSKLDEMVDEVTIRLKIRVRDYEQLSELLSRLGSVNNVIEARRLRLGGVGHRSDAGPNVVGGRYFQSQAAESVSLVERLKQFPQTQPRRIHREIFLHVFQAAG